MISVWQCKKLFVSNVKARRQRGVRRSSVFQGALRYGVLVVAAIAAVSYAVPNALALVITDDFTDGTDGAAATATNPASPPNVSGPVWSHLDGNVGSTAQVWDASTGQYRIAAPGNSGVAGVEGYGFGGSYIATSFTDVRVSADIVEFPNVGAFGSWFAIAARLNGDNNLPSAGVGLPLRGYSYQYESSSNGSLGEMVLNLVYGDGLKDLRSQKGASITVPLLDNTKDYRFVFEVIGNVLHGQVLNLTDGGVTVAEQFRNLDVEPVGNIDHDADNATPEIPFVPYTNGYSGAYAVGHVFLSDGDFTIDNFRTETAVAGDYNRNGVVDGADYVLWRKTQGNIGPVGNPPASFADMRANGAVSAGESSQVIDQADRTFWRSNFGNSASGIGAGSGGAVPEPASGLIVFVGLVSFAFRRRNR